jgi:hypothetical protein
VVGGAGGLAQPGRAQGHAPETSLWVGLLHRARST